MPVVSHVFAMPLRPLKNVVAIGVPGHALELDAISQRAALLGLWRQVNRDRSLAAKAQATRDHAQLFQGGGLVRRVWPTIAQLDWRWPSLGAIFDD